MSQRYGIGGRKPTVHELTKKYYLAIIDETISKVKPEFVHQGVDEPVLDELRALWEQNLMKSGVLVEDIKAEPQRPAPPIQPISRQPAPVQPNFAASRPAAQIPMPTMQAGGALQMMGMRPMMAMTPAMMQQLAQAQVQFMQQQQHAQVQQFQQLQQAQQHQLQVQQQQQQLQLQQQVQQQQQQFHQPPQQQQAQPAVAQPPTAPFNLFLRADESKKRKLDRLTDPPPPDTVPQQDGPADDGAGDSAPPAGTAIAATQASDPDTAAPADGDGAAPATTAAAPAALASNDEALGEGDDLADVDEEEVNEDTVSNVIMGQFEKVQRTKGKWKVTMKGCIVTIGGREYLLKKLTGEMQFH